ncbi:MAG: MarR family transcriptional regulator, partial [Clostridia bacterium]
MVRAWSILYRQTYLFFKRHMTEATAINGTDQIIALYVGDHPGVNQDNISSYFMINKTTVTKALDRLEKTGYITRSVRPQNRRENAINLTPYGEQAATSIREMLAHWRN